MKSDSGGSLNEPADRQADAMEQDREQMDRLTQSLEATRLVRAINDRDIEELEAQIQILTNRLQGNIVPRQLPNNRLELKAKRRRRRPLHRNWRECGYSTA